MPITTLPLDHLLASTDQADFSGRRALSDVSAAVVKAKRVVVVSGAGISCSSGIPDFRSEKGLYSLVKARYPDAFFTGKDLFSSGLFSNPRTTSIFYTFIAELALMSAEAELTDTHHFIRRLETKGKLLRSYTQNVDGLERKSGLESGGRGQGLKKKGTRNVELHGDLGRVRCVLCMKDYHAEKKWIDMFRDGEAPDCPCCLARSESRVSRSARALPIGTLRPSIVLYDEPHPLGDDIGDLQTYDLGRNPDLLLIMGTSLKVHGLKRVVKEFAKVVHNRKGGLVVFVNATPPSKEWEGIIDVHVHGETDKWVNRVNEEWKHLRPADWEIQEKLDETFAVTGKPLPQVDKKPVKLKAAKRPTKAKPKAAPAPQMPPTPPPSQPSVSAQSQSPTSSLSSAPPTESESDLTDLPPSPESLPLDGPSPQSQRLLAPIEALPPAPPTPVSPSKRQISASFSSSCIDRIARSPMKKTKSFPAAATSTPGRGNLFAPRLDNQAVPPPDGFDVTAESDLDVFGSPTKSALPPQTKSQTGHKHAVSAPKPRRTRAKTSDKENQNPVAAAAASIMPRTSKRLIAI